MSTALITGASGGIGAVYARRLAARGQSLILVARSAEKLQSLAAELHAAYAVTVEVISADLTQAADLALVEKRLREGEPVDILGSGLITH